MACGGGRCGYILERILTRFIFKELGIISAWNTSTIFVSHRYIRKAKSFDMKLFLVSIVILIWQDGSVYNKPLYSRGDTSAAAVVDLSRAKLWYSFFKKKTSETTNYRATIMKNDDDKTKDNHVTQSSTVLPEVVVPVIPVRTRGGGRSQWRYHQSFKIESK